MKIVNNEIIGFIDSAEDNYVKDGVETDYQRFITQREKELAKCFEKWDKTHLLSGSLEERQELALILENQELFNQMVSTRGEIHDNFRILSIGILSMIFHSDMFTPFKFVKVQTMLGPASLFFYKGDLDILREETIAAYTRKLNTSFAMMPLYLESVELLADQISTEIITGILTDLRSNCLVVRDCFDYVAYLDEVVMKLREVSGRHHIKIIGTQQSLGELEKTDCELITCHHMPANELLLATDRPGYVYAPYVMLASVPSQDEDTCNIISRYGKKLLPGGPRQYARIRKV